MHKRILAAVLGVLGVMNGLTMLFYGEHWYLSSPGVASTGPFNSHFVADVGVAFIAAGLALSARSWRGRYWSAAVAGSAFLVFHALIHLVEFVLHPHDLLLLLGIAVPAALAMWAALPTQGEMNVQRLRAQID